MKIEKSSYYRLSRIDSLLKTGKFPNCSDMAAAHEVSRRTILRDIEYMKDMFGAPIEYSPLRRGYYYTKSYSLPNIEFLNEGDLFSLCIAERSVDQYRNTPIYEYLTRVYARISAMLPEEVSVKKEWIGSHYSIFSGSSAQIQPQIWETFAAAAAGNRRIRIVYQRMGNFTPSEREIDCYHIIGYQGDWFAVSYCHLRRELRTFALSRVLEASLTDESFTVPESFDLSQIVGRNFGITDEGKTFSVEVEFSADVAASVMRTVWHPEQRVHQRRDGSVRISFCARSLREVRGWVLSYGEDARAIRPRELVEDIRETLESAERLYR